VSWGGTAASSADEWIELHNNTRFSVDVTDWTLQDAINADLQVEVDKFQKDTLDKFIVYPVISMGISFTFF
jgi:hypothetical protein